MNLTRRQLNEMYNKFPGLEGYIARCENLNEYRHLAINDLILNEYQRKRKAELEDFCGYTWEDVTKENAKDTVFDLLNG
jgi:hypothetical protein